jgi:hypothetical protein
MNLARSSAEMLIASPLAAKDERCNPIESVIEYEQEDSVEIDGRPELSQ